MIITPILLSKEHLSDRSTNGDMTELILDMRHVQGISTVQPDNKSNPTNYYVKLTDCHISLTKKGYDLLMNTYAPNL